MHYVKKYWMMAETGNPQFVIACSPVSCASGVMCLSFSVFSLPVLGARFNDMLRSYYTASLYGTSRFWYGESDDKWSLKVIFMVQSIGIAIGSIAPIFRWFVPFNYFNLSKKRSMIHLNIFKVEKYWTLRLQQWKGAHVVSHIPGRRCKKVFHVVKNMILNFCIALHILVLVLCKTVCFTPKSCLTFFSCCFDLCYSLLKRLKKEPKESHDNTRPETEEYNRYVVQVEKGMKLSKSILRISHNCITHKSEKNEPTNLLKLLEKSIGFNGLVEFDNDQIPPLNPEETHNCWTLVATTLTAIAIALPNITDDRVNWFLASMSEGLEFVRHIEENLNANGELVKVGKTGRRMWTEVEVHSKWLEIDLQKGASAKKTSEQILRWLGDEAIKMVIHFRHKNESMDHSLHKFIAASSMYRISQTILLHFNEQEKMLTDEELFERILTVIADILCACFTNLPPVIAMKCHHIETGKREESIWTAARLLGKSKKILNILKLHQLPNLDVDSMAYIDEWHAMLKRSQTTIACASTARIQLSSLSSSDHSIVLNVL